ncbi:amidohydrolase family protein [Tahibacter soli]|uniref:Amidohydrolase family protein n=1 Tax=Tahibacter soli TaxID=2983605 RepID=A0A9X4BIK1_9GAMM|nr:amidohydrolase family protein [Tahibacter soli]MDC8012327.1 amidohydrolase family protein [Tahibacter soli]
MRHLGFVLCLAAGSASAAAQREDVMTILGNVSGKQTVTQGPAGTNRAHFRYNDRGRGDDIVATWKTDANGVLVEYRAKGNNYLKAPVDETYALKNGKATWRSLGERGERAVAAPTFYVPANPPPELTGVLARALLKAPDRRLPLLPAGEASIAEAGTLQIDTAAGKRTLTLYRISGLDFVATSVWLDADGTTAALVNGWGGVAGKDVAASVEALTQRQTAANAQWSAQLAQRETHRPAGPLVIRNARVFDPRSLTATTGTSVLVVGERIVRVAPDTEVQVPDGAETFDANGRFLMAGLWDVHKHYGDADGLLDILAGITSARDLANDTEAFPERVRRFDAGTEIGPRVLMAGFIDGTGPNAGPTKARVDNAADALKWVDWYADHGYVQIKVYSSLRPELVPIIADRAHARGLRLSGHVPSKMSAKTFVEAGADEIQHFNFIFLSFLYPRVQETHDMTRFTEVAQHAREYPPERAEVRDLIAFLKARHVALDPTIHFFEDMFSGDPTSKVPAALADVAPRLPPQVQRNLSWGALVVPKGQEAQYREAFPAMLKLLKAFHDAGIPLMPGSDALAGYSLQYELMLYAKAGIPNGEVLRLATLTPAQVLGVAGDRGMIAPGKLADMVLIDGDPLANMADIRKVARVYKGGSWFDPAALERALGISPRPAR